MTRVKAKEAEGPPTLDLIVRNLGERRKKLDQMDDRLATTIRTVEAVMRDNIAVRVVKLIGQDTFSREFEQLAFTKLNGKWCLAIEEGQASNNEDDDDISTRNPLGSCSREKRAQMFAEGHIDALLRSALGQVESEIEKREAAMHAADALMSELGSILPPPPPEPSPTDLDDIPF